MSAGSPASRATPRMPGKRSARSGCHRTPGNRGDARYHCASRGREASHQPHPHRFTSSGVISIIDMALESFDATTIFATLVGSDFAHEGG